jgi:pimeloyl-ACP methyl ester carboxylesterase
VLLIHGAGGNHLSWPAQIRRLPDQRLYAVDLPAHGRSDGIGRQRIEDYSNDVLALIDELRIYRAVLIGHSMGGAIALDITVRYRKRVLGLGLIGSGARLPVDPAIMRNAAQEANYPVAVRQIGERSFAAATSPRLKELALERMAEVRSSVLHGDLMACDAFDRMADLRTVELPTLVVCGVEDQMTPPKYSQYVHQQIPGSVLHIVQDAGHMVMLEQADRVAGHLAQFLNSIAYEPGRAG